ncbi:MULTISPECIES: low molecular weight protein-tyrosine-phosphatase [unclassified Marinobacterium]|uniref:low molecular weight protein-tyrosine-phosphatase n=1 Tax=unclassified Marinobacterium TaxID=2644139 RepID=UPI001568FB59|nr:MULTISPECIES: low molecular weight protein-tyrosine-phosphatase [unclassified Marinobacterium]NRP58901.1 Low molecular weight protein-tyrosine-phosphatase YfkJ [Marinobacterium sp. xm-d-564]NRQ01782.1 Low molecular weight protein-tyrosine-phosphatase YfkJ [Marinobacterium sp. xm-d-530]
MIRVLFVCLGNICRSPSADAIFRKKLDDHPWLANRVEVDSAGTAAWHVGNPPDPRSVRVGAERGYDLTPLRARQATAADFERFDYILAMDETNLDNLQAIAPNHYSGHLSLFLDFSGKSGAEVPDPYYGEGDSGFHEVVDLIEAASDGLIKQLEVRLA